MNYEARRMMLLGSIDGKISDLNKMICLSNTQMVNCFHSEDNFNAVFTDNTHKNIGNLHETEIKIVHVELKSLAFGGVKVGRIGKCTCGKIYYSPDD